MGVASPSGVGVALEEGEGPSVAWPASPLGVGEAVAPAEGEGPSVVWPAFSSGAGEAVAPVVGAVVFAPSSGSVDTAALVGAEVDPPSAACVPVISGCVFFVSAGAVVSEFFVATGSGVTGCAVAGTGVAGCGCAVGASANAAESSRQSASNRAKVRFCIIRMAAPPFIRQRSPWR